MLTVHRAERADVLADALADRLVVPPADPMAREVIAVPARGVERWLAQRLALRLGSAGRDDGVAANIDFPSPERLLREVVGATADQPEAAQEWYSEALVWPVLRVIDEQLDDRRLHVLRAHVSGPAGRGRRFAAASTVAGLFRGYGWQRPGMLAEWAAGDDTDGAGGALPEPLSWQPWFWRAVREQIGQPHPAERLDEVARVLAADRDVVDLPDRLAFFGPTRVPEAMRLILRALGEQRDVALFVPHPGDALWRKVAAQPAPVPRTRAAATAVRPDHPLLAALSRDVIELQEVLAPLGGRDVYHPLPAEARRATLLGAVQDGLRRDELVADTERTLDDSLEVHACHGPERQVEVLRERLVRLFDDHPGLQPRDVLIMCPDVETFAPLIHGAFEQTGQVRGPSAGGSRHPGAALRVRLADRGLRETNEVLDVLAAVLDLAAGRVRASDLLDLIAAPAVRRRFAFTDDDLELLAGWVDRAGVRWGIDAIQRDRFGMTGFPQGTVAAGRDRLLLGVLAEEDENEWLGVGLPLDGIESTKVDLVGRFAELVDRLGRLLAQLDGRRSAPAWASLLTAVIDQLTEPAHDAEWQRGQALTMIGDSLGTAAAESTELVLSDVRDLMAGLLAARPSRTSFCTGELTVCTLTPMRSVPHRAIVLLGMDTGAFPRSAGVDGDDILGRVPLVGERNRRDEDRQVFLDAITAAADHLLVFYTGSDPVTGSEVPPPVVVSELIDTAQRVLGRAPDQPGIERRHTLHAFDERNFRRGPDRRPISYDTSLVDGARALAALNASGEPGRPLPRLAGTVLPPADGGDVDLAELVAFFKDPVAQFVVDRLGARLPRHDEGHRDELDVDLDGLAAWKIGDRRLRGVLAGESASSLAGAEQRRGTLPPFALGRATLTPIEQKAEGIGALAQTHRGDRSAGTVDVRLVLPDGRRVYGTVGDVFAGPSGAGDTLIEVGYSRLKPEHRLAAWIRLLATAAAGHPMTEGIVVGAGYGRAEQRRLRVPDDPAAALAVLVAIRDAGLRAPLWLPPPAAEVAARAARRPTVALRAVHGLKPWDRASEYGGLVCHDDPARNPSVDELIGLAGAVPFAEVADRLPDPGEAETWMREDQRTFLRLANAVFGPLLEQETQR